MSRDEHWVSYAPKEISKHVVGRYTEATTDEDGKREEQKVEGVCNKCGANFRRACQTGAVREHISRFARVHQHKDPFA